MSDSDHSLIQYPKSMLTSRQQVDLRGRLMLSAAKIASQLDEYVESNKITLNNGNEVKMSPARLQAYRLILERTIPTLSATEIKHKSSLESISTDALVARLASLAKQRPDLSQKLLEALGGRVIEPARTHQGESLSRALRAADNVVEPQAAEPLTINASVNERSE